MLELLSSDVLGAIEDAIIDRLSPLQDNGLKIVGAPERQGPASRADCQFFLTAINPHSTGASVRQPLRQRATLEYTANVIIKDLRSHRIAYPYVQAIASLLKGFAPEGIDCTAIEFGGCQYRILEQKEGLRWHYELSFSLEAVLPRLKN